MYLKAALAHCIVLVFLFQAPFSSHLHLGVLLLAVGSRFVSPTKQGDKLYALTLLGSSQKQLALFIVLPLKQHSGGAVL